MIEFRKLSSGHGGKMIIKDYDLKIPKGDIVAILGPNGVGKTTLLNTIVGTKKDFLGELKVNGNVGYVPQLFDMPFSYSVLDVVLMGRARHIGLYGSPKSYDYEISEKYIELMGVSHLINREFNQLSGGQKQLVMIAQALTSECDLLILDEPCSALDYKNQSIVLSQISNLNESFDLTIIYTTHMPQHAIETANKSLLMGGENNYKFGVTNEVLTEKNLSDLYGIEVAKANFEKDGAITMAPRFGI